MKFGLHGLLLAGWLFATMPASASYQLHNYGFGSGGTSGSTSATYSLNATTGEQSNAQATSATYKARTGNQNTQQANVTAAPSFTNPSSYYDKLKFIIDNGNNPTDAKFSIAISTDNFVTTNYVQLDDTIGSTKIYQTYANWGGASGQLVIGLSPSTTYYMKVNAIQGNFTETEYSTVVSAATVAPSISFDIDVSPIDTSTSPPYATSFGSLLPATVTNTPDKVWASFTTNADNGGTVYISSVHAGLQSSRASFTLTSATADLSAVSTGYGAQGLTATQASGGPFSIASPYNVASQNVGILDTGVRGIFTTTAPITTGRASLQLKAKAAALTPAASDYTDTLTLIAAASF